MPIGKARMRKMFTGRNMETRPIPREMYTDDYREEIRNAVQTQTRPGPQYSGPPTVKAASVSGRIIRQGVNGNSFYPTSNAKQR